MSWDYAEVSCQAAGASATLCYQPYLSAFCYELRQLIALLPVILSATQESEGVPNGADALGPGCRVVLTGTLPVIALWGVQVSHPVVVCH